MGVSLERVQNKFACIIGELCSEPLILSQFAVWVDLRIAEYKTKGTISLDCSGDSPNPTWMKGVKIDGHSIKEECNSLDTRQRSRYHDEDMYGTAGDVSVLYKDRVQSPESIQADNSEETFHSRLSPDIMVLNDQSDFDQLQPHAIKSPKRKHSLDEGDLKGVDYCRTKSRCLGNSLSAQKSSSNQSLMSIINAENNAGSGSTDFLSSAVQEDMLESQGFASWNATSSPLPQQPSIQSPGSPNHQSPRASQVNSNQSETRTLQHVKGSSKRHADSAVRTFVWWLSCNGAQDCRSIESIPPKDLDDLLSNFFASVKKPTGEEYSPKSLLAIRTGLEYHLKQHMYPVSITASPQFTRNLPVAGWSDWHLRSPEQIGRLYRGSWCVEKRQPLRMLSLSANAVKLFAGWLRSVGNVRLIEEIPCAELDVYLADFFSSVKRKDGSEYKSESLRSLRNALDFHLREKNYGYSITSSPEFQKCQAAYKSRMFQLKMR